MRRMISVTSALLVAAGLTVVGTSPPASALECHERTDMVQFLDQIFREKQAAIGLTETGEQVAELFVSEDGTWTLVITNPEGQACILVSGASWEAVPVLGPQA